jgi:hypothetical protein
MPWGLGARPNWSSPGWGFFQPRAMMWRIGLQGSLHSGEGPSNKVSFSQLQKKASLDENFFSQIFF